MAGKAGASASAAVASVGDAENTAGVSLNRWEREGLQPLLEVVLEHELVLVVVFVFYFVLLLFLFSCYYYFSFSFVFCFSVSFSCSFFYL